MLQKLSRLGRGDWQGDVLAGECVSWGKGDIPVATSSMERSMSASQTNDTHQIPKDIETHLHQTCLNQQQQMSLKPHKKHQQGVSVTEIVTDWWYLLPSLSSLSGFINHYLVIIYLLYMASWDTKQTENNLLMRRQTIIEFKCFLEAEPGITSQELISFWDSLANEVI